MFHRFLIGGACYLLLTFPSFSQGEELSLILQKLGSNCRQIAKTNYRSPELVQPRSGRVFFVTGTLQRRPRQDTTNGGNCFPIKAETPTVTLNLLERRVNLVPLFRHRSTAFFNYVKPVAFSPNGRYLVLQVLRSNGIDLYSSIDVIDTERRYLSLYLNICPDATFGATFKGFVDNDRVEFNCVGDANQREVWDLSRRQTVKRSPNIQQALYKTLNE